MPTPACPICREASTTRLREYRSTLAHSDIFLPLSLYKCESCTGLFAFEAPSEEALAHYYVNHYRTTREQDHKDGQFDGWNGASVRARSQIDFIQPDKEVVSWLDIGAGYGDLLDQVRRVGIANTAGVEVATSIGSSHVRYHTLDEVEGTWGVVSLSHVLEHFADPHKLLTKLKKLMAPKGLAFCEVPNELWSDRNNDTPHLFFYTPRALERLFKENNFRVLRIDTCGPIYGRQTRSEQLLRRVGWNLWKKPPLWYDRLCHSEFKYGGPRCRIRLLAAID